jgi:xylulose-5-phosphate/fructose-6-phosphate phosphoketolase
MATTLDKVVGEIQRIKSDARRKGFSERPRWPMIVLRRPKGWTCPKEIDGKRTEDYWRSHQVPTGEMHENAAHVRILEQWMKSYRPGELFDDSGRLRNELADLAPRGTRRMSANPHTNGGLLLRELRLPNFRDYAVEVPAPGAVTAESTRVMGRFPTRCDEAEHGAAKFPAVQPRREQLEPLAGCARGHQSCLGRGNPSLG